MLDAAKVGNFVDQCWGDDIVPTLIEYIQHPEQIARLRSGMGGARLYGRGGRLFERWARERLAGLPGATLEVVRLPGRTPLILIEVPAAGTEQADGDTVLLYGHLDKQPEMVGWADGYGPWMPRLEGDKLYGRGGADDGYAMFGALTALLALARAGRAARPLRHRHRGLRGIRQLRPALLHRPSRRPASARPSLVVCLDSGCGNYDQLWLTTSLRGIAAGTLTVEVLDEGVHSGDASGVVPSSFRILRQLLSRLEDEATGAIRPAALYVQVPAERVEQAKRAAAALGDEHLHEVPVRRGGTKPMADDPVELVLNRTWRPQLAVTGIDGLPQPADAGNVLLPYTTAKLSLRLPPTLDARSRRRDAAKRCSKPTRPTAPSVVRAAGRVSRVERAGPGAVAGASLARASQAAFGAPPAYMGEGGSIPFMAMLGEKFPAAQFVVTGVLGPHSNAHGPNEFLHSRPAGGSPASSPRCSPIIAPAAHRTRSPVSAGHRQPGGGRRSQKLLSSLRKAGTHRAVGELLEHGSLLPQGRQIGDRRAASPASGVFAAPKRIALPSIPRSRRRGSGCGGLLRCGGLRRGGLRCGRRPCRRRWLRHKRR